MSTTNGVRVRLRYTEHGPIRFLGHRDLARCWERALRRAELPVAYSEGFSPRPKLHFGLALSVGAESDAEYLDIDVTVPVDAAILPGLLTPLLPAGVEVVAATSIERSAPALQAAIDVVVWHLQLDPASDIAAARSSVAALAARDSVPVEIERKGQRRAADVRPVIRSLGVTGLSESVVVAELATRPQAIRPAELIAAFEPPLEVRLVTRHEQLMTVDGQLVPPLPVAGRPDPAVRRLAS